MTTTLTAIVAVPVLGCGQQKEESDRLCPPRGAYRRHPQVRAIDRNERSSKR